MSKKFKVKNVNSIDIQRFDDYNFEILACSDTKNCVNFNKIYFKAYAMKTLHKSIKWGSTIVVNQIEKWGLLIGSVYKKKDNYFSIVESIIPILESELTNISKYSFETWQRLLEIATNKCSNNKLILGWYHTHQGNREVYMSKRDMHTHKMFACNWQFGVVLNPQKKIWRVYNGINANECKGLIINN